MKNQIKHSLLLISLLFINIVIAQEEEIKDVAKEAQNPLGNVISLPFQSNTDFGIGEYDKTGTVLNIQPIIPVLLGEKGWLLMNRFIIPLPKSIPNLESEDANNITGIGDISYTAWFSPPGKKGKLTWGFGPVTIWPTASDDRLGQGKFSIGPSFVFVKATPKFVAAAVISNWWSVAGDSDRADVNTFYFQYIFTYFLPKKWYATTAPIILADWEMDSDQRWVVPFGAGIGKMFKIGKLPLDLNAHVYYNAIKPDGYADWQFRTQLKFIFPSRKKK